MAARKTKPPEQTGAKVLRELIAQFPDAPAMTLAKRAYRENPELWTRLEMCRSAVRRILGTRGGAHRQTTKDKTLFRAPRPAGWQAVIPDALVQLPDWRAVQFNGPLKALVLSDIHIPFHDPAALALALDYGRKRKTDFILLNGDLMDHYQLSKFQTDPRLRVFPQEVAAGKFFLKGLRKRFGTARIVLKFGNHEERYERYMQLKCPEFLGVPEFDWETVFGLREAEIELVKDCKPIRLGALNVIHGHEYRFQISNPVNPARGFFLRAKAHTLGGHLHQTSQHSEKNVEGKVVTTFSTGCLCDLRPQYRPLNPWNSGFAYVEVDKSGGFHVANLRIVDGQIW